MENIEKEIEEKSVSETREERLTELVRAVWCLRLVRGYGVRKSYAHVAAELVNLTRLVTDGREDTGVLEVGRPTWWSNDRVVFYHSHRDDVGPWLMRLVNTQDAMGRSDCTEDRFREAINTLVAEAEKKGLEDYQKYFYNKMCREFVPEVVLSDMFFKKCEFWEIEVDQKHTLSNPVSPQALLVATNLYAFFLDRELQWVVKRDNISRQIGEYLEFGKVLFEKYPEIVPHDRSTQPEPLLTINEDGRGLVWKHGKYCPKCGKLIDGCYCTSVYQNKPGNIDQTGDEVCWTCRKQMLVRSLMEEGDKTDDAMLSGYEDILVDGIISEAHSDSKATQAQWEEYLTINVSIPEDDPDFAEIDIIHKKLTLEQAEAYIDLISECYDPCDYDPPEDMCSCPLE